MNLSVPSGGCRTTSRNHHPPQAIATTENRKLQHRPNTSDHTDRDTSTQQEKCKKSTVSQRYIRKAHPVTQGVGALVLLSGCMNVQATPPLISTEACFKARKYDFSEVLACYKNGEALKPLQYTFKEIQHFPGIEKRSFELISQNWSPHNLVKPKQWKHEVNIYIPSHALHGQALLVANNGTNHPSSNDDGIKAASDFSEKILCEIAKQTCTIIISVSDIPNQYLTYTDDSIARREDDSVAHSWKLFLKKPETRAFMSLHIPMMESIVKTMDLAQKELQEWKISRFIASGVSKRGWSVWLAAIADDRISVAVPFVIDILNVKKVLEHTYQAYGKNWPVAFAAYQREGITKELYTKNFDKLLQMEDPLRYLKNSVYAKRLSIPKYIVNASGDDFFVPDNARFYFDQLPGQKTLRVTPNSSHQGIREFIEESLIPVTNRLQHAQRLPLIKTQLHNKAPGKDVLSLHFSEKPIRITQWIALNPLARDFRYFSGIRYQSHKIMPTRNRNAKITINTPIKGWSATFIEVKFSDGLVATTPVYVTPNTYPKPTLGK